MSNPIQDWLGKILNPGKSASGQSGVGSDSKPTASGQASAGAASLPTMSQVQTDLQKQKEAMAKITNQQIINAVYKVAEDLKLKGGPWPLLRAAGWGHLTDKRGNFYKGPAIDEIAGLTPEQKTALKIKLGL